MPKIGVADPTLTSDAFLDADLDTLATALYARTDDLLKASPERVPWRPVVGWLRGSATRRSSRWPESRDAVRRSELAGWAEYGYCASHSRYFWGLRLHLVATLHGLPIGYALTGAKADERQVLLELLDADPTLAASRPGQVLIADKNYYGRAR